VDAHIDRTYISGIENASFNPTVDVLDRLALALGVDLSVLVATPTGNEPTTLKPGRKPK
jgi:transcriptional regulator with XRE-family HTH domain